MKLKNKDKKGIAPILILVLAGIIVGVVLVGFLLFSGTTRWVLIGIGVIIGAIWISGQAMTSEFTAPKIVFILILFFVGVVLIFGAQYFQVTYEANIFVKPDWARLECAPTDAYEVSYSLWLDQETFFKCDGFTEECRFKIINNPPSSCNLPGAGSVGKYAICDLVGGSCTTKYTYNLCGGQESDWIYIESGRSVKFDTGLLVTDEDQTEIRFEYKPWKLYRFVDGAKWIVSSENCNIVSFSKSSIRDVDYPSSEKLYRQGGEGVKWINYINDWNFGPATNIFNHPEHGQIYCTAGQVFEIVEVKIADGSVVKVDPQYSTTLPSGERLSGLGRRLEYVECCPNEPNCGDDFKYLPEPEPDRECVSDIQCYNAGGPVPKRIDGVPHYVVWKCINDYCTESSPIEVECIVPADCSPGEICDLSTLNYGVCIEQKPEYCGDGTCDITETIESCPADCKEEEIECKWWQDSYTQEMEDCGALEWKKWTPFIECDTYTEKGCRTSLWVYLGGIILFFTIIITMLLVLTKPKSSRRKRR